MNSGSSSICDSSEESNMSTTSCVVRAIAACGFIGRGRCIVVVRVLRAT